MDDLTAVVLLGLLAGLVVAAARRSARVPVGGQTWDNEKVTLFASGIYQRGAVTPRSYIIPVTCARYDGHDGNCWYACGSIDQIISHLHLTHYAAQEDE